MPHTDDKRYAVVSCHVERPLDDACWARFSALQERRPGGFAVAALMRPPDPAHGEDESAWLERARAAAARGPFGLHTHWTSPTYARPSGGEAPGERVRHELAWLASSGLEPTLFCGGGWYTDVDVAAACAAAGVADCTPRRERPPYLDAGAPWAQLGAPARVALPRGGELLALPTTRSLGALARAVLRPGGIPEPVVHAYLHDTDLLDARRRAALHVSLALLARRRSASDLDALRAAVEPDAAHVAWDDTARG